MNFYDEILYRIGLPPETAIGRKVLFVDTRAVYVEGPKGLTVLSDGEIRFRYGKKILSVKGEKLKLNAVSCDEAYVVGVITSVGVENA